MSESTSQFEGTEEQWAEIAQKNKVLYIAKVCHEANRAWCLSEGDYSQDLWENADEWQRRLAIKGVEFRLANPTAGEDAQHNVFGLCVSLPLHKCSNLAQKLIGQIAQNPC